MHTKQGTRKSLPIDIGIMETLIGELTDVLAPKSPSNLNADLATVRGRYAAEGDGFLTIVMPALSESVYMSFSSGQYLLNPDLGFKPKKGWKTPAFLQCFFTRVFDRSGFLLDDACHFSVYALLQILNLYKKVERPLGAWCAKALDEFRVRATEPRPFKLQYDLRTTAARRVLSELFVEFAVEDIRGKHGPGVTAEKLSPADKWDSLTWPEGADWLWPPREHFCPPGADDHEKDTRIKRVGNLASRLILVPKTSKTPRLIAAEPAGLQYLQGGLAEKLVNRVEDHWLTAGHVNFTDQTINRDLARRSSVDGSFATIDLSDASDTVGLELVRDLFPTHVGVALDLLRCSEVSVYEDTLSPTFYATMGSALTFVVESLVFFSVSVGAIMAHDRQLCSGLATEDDFPSVVGPRIAVGDRGSYARARNAVYVYGDDIIVATKYADVVLEALRDFGFKPSLKKTFTQGPFRESCGSDCFKGTQVRPIYVRKYIPETRKDGSRIVSLLETANTFADQGLFLTAAYIYRLLPGYPVGDGSESYLTQRFATHNSVRRTRWNRQLQRREICSEVVKSTFETRSPSQAGLYHAALTRRIVGQSSFLRSSTATSLLRRRWSRA